MPTYLRLAIVTIGVITNFVWAFPSLVHEKREIACNGITEFKACNTQQCNCCTDDPNKAVSCTYLYGFIFLNCPQCKENSDPNALPFCQ